MWNFLCALNLFATSLRVHSLTLKYAVLTTNKWVNSSSYESVPFTGLLLQSPMHPSLPFVPTKFSQEGDLWDEMTHSAAMGGRWRVALWPSSESRWVAGKRLPLSLGVWLSCMVLMTDWQKGHTHKKTQKTTFHPQKVYHHMSAWVLLFCFYWKCFMLRRIDRTPWGTKYTFVQKWIIYVESFEGFRFVFCHKPKEITFLFFYFFKYPISLILSRLCILDSLALPSPSWIM